MKHLHWLCVCTLAAAAGTVATPAAATPPKGETRSGGLGWAFTGVFFNRGSLLSKELQYPTALGPDHEAGSLGASFGGGGGTLLFGSFWVGGKGFGAWMPGSSTSRGWERTSFGGGALELGFAAINRSVWLVTPFVEFGAIGYSVEVGSRMPSMQVANVEIPANAKGTFDAASATLGLGARGHRLILFNGSGMTAGIEFGALVSIAPGRWNLDGQPVQASRPSLAGGYLRFFLGGGGFYGD
jgi:hypothetical protein